MAEPFLGQIIQAGFNFAPQGWATCDGQLMAIQQQTALFSLLGTTFGGNGIQTFGLPDLRGRLPLHQGSGPGLTPRVMGEFSGEEQHTLLNPESPSHSHTVKALSTNGASKSPAGNVLAFVQGAAENIYSASAPNSQMNQKMIGNAGSSAPHNNLQPFLVTNFCICLSGVYPSRS